MTGLALIHWYKECQKRDGTEREREKEKEKKDRRTREDGVEIYHHTFEKNKIKQKSQKKGGGT